MSWTRLGVKYRKVRSRDNRYGPGKVHVARWSRNSHDWEPICMTIGEGAFVGMGYSTVDDDQPVQCKRCIAVSHAWASKKVAT